MFERYTEQARRAIFHARFEASRVGASEIETPHLLVGVLTERSPACVPVISDEAAESLLAEIRASRASRSRVSTSVDMPLSLENKRVLAYASEEAEALGVLHIGTEHLLLGLLREDTAARRVLQYHGVQRDGAWNSISADSSRHNPVRPESVSRADLHELLDSLPDGAIPSASSALHHLRVWPPAPFIANPHMTEMRERMQQRMRDAGIAGMRGAGGGGGGFGSGPGGRNGNFSFSVPEEGASVVETHRFYEGHEITIIERMRISENRRSLEYTIDIAGPGQERKVDLAFDISPSDES